MTILTIAHLTIRETQRRRILWVAIIMGVAFIALFSIGFHYIYQEFALFTLDTPNGQETAGIFVNFLRIAGLYAVYFLALAMSALISANTISGEIESHTIDTLVTKPIQRFELILGKWLGLAIIITIYTVVMAGSLVLYVSWRTGEGIGQAPAGIALMILGTLVMLSITLAGGTRLSTLANGALAFMLYGVSFIGGWVEQIGAVLRNETAVDIGIISSLIMPADVLWKRATTLFQPASLSSFDFAGPFVVASQPHDRMIVYAILYVIAFIAIALWSFSRRDL